MWSDVQKAQFWSQNSYITELCNQKFAHSCPSIMHANDCPFYVSYTIGYWLYLGYDCVKKKHTFTFCHPPKW